MQGFVKKTVCLPLAVFALAALILVGCSGGESSIHPKYRLAYRKCLEFLEDGVLSQQAQEVNTGEVWVRDLGWEERDAVIRLEPEELRWDERYWVFVLGEESTGVLKIVCDSQTDEVVGYLE